jgi:PAS domain S-box-containing protein
MDYVHLAVIGSSVGTITIVLIYIYLYAMYRQRHMGIWAIGWVILLSRYLVIDLWLPPWKQCMVMAAYQIMTIGSAFLFVWATYIFLNKPFNRWWLYGAAGATAISTFLDIWSSSLFLKLTLPVYFGCFVCLWIGQAFIRKLHLRGIGHMITGYAYILWGILNIAAPVLLEGSWFLPWAYSIGGILRLIIAIGILMVYFENTRIELVAKEKQYRILAENAIDIIYYYKLLPERKIEYVSPSVLSLTGYSPEEIYADHKLIYNLVHADDHPLIEKFVNELPDSIGIPLTLRLIAKNKTMRYFEQKSVPIYNEAGQVIALEGIVRDITMRNKLEKMASLFDRMNMVGNMAATVAHEIRNPMTTVRGYLQILGRKEKYAADKEKFILMIEELDRADTIIREYLSLSREKAADFKQCSLNTIIETLFPLIHVNANTANVYAVHELNAIPEFMMDANEIRQLLLNLTRNGIEAMAAGGKLLIRTYQEEDKVILSVSDQGPGIPPHILENIGTPFVTTKDSGTGLGLPICYQIAHRHNASIKISTCEAGTTFFVNFCI